MLNRKSKEIKDTFNGYYQSYAGKEVSTKLKAVTLMYSL